MKRDGFVLVETITMFLVLISALLFFYVYANNLFLKEKEYSYYDDVTSIYNGYYIKEALHDYSQISSLLTPSLFNGVYGFVVGSDYGSTFFTTTQKRDKFYEIANELNLYQMFLVKDIKQLKTCARDIDTDSKCHATFIDEDMRSYIKTINTNGVDSEYYIIMQFKKDSKGNVCTVEDCFSYFTWVALWSVWITKAWL